MALSIQDLRTKKNTGNQEEQQTLSNAVENLRLTLAAISYRAQTNGRPYSHFDNMLEALNNISLDPDIPENEARIQNGMNGIRQFNSLLQQEDFRQALNEELRLEGSQQGEDLDAFTNSFYSNLKTFEDYYGLTDELAPQQIAPENVEEPVVGPEQNIVPEAVQNANVQPVVQNVPVQDEAGEHIEPEIEIPDKPANAFYNEILTKLGNPDFAADEAETEVEYEKMRVAFNVIGHPKRTFNTNIKQGNKTINISFNEEDGKKWLAENFEKLLATQHDGKTIEEFILDGTKEDKKLEVKQALAYAKKQAGIFREDLKKAAEAAPKQPAEEKIEIASTAEAHLNTIKAAARRGTINQLPGYPDQVLATVLAIRALTESRVGHASSLQAKLTPSQIKQKTKEISEDPNFKDFVRELELEDKMDDALAALKAGHCGGVEKMFRNHLKNMEAGDLQNTNAVSHYMPTVKERIEALQNAAKSKIKEQDGVAAEAAEIIALRNIAHIERDRKSCLNVKIPTTEKGTLKGIVENNYTRQDFCDLVEENESLVIAGHGGDMIDKMRIQFADNRIDNEAVRDFINQNTIGGRMSEIKKEAAEYKAKLEEMKNTDPDSPEMKDLTGKVMSLTGEYTSLIKNAAGKEFSTQAYRNKLGENVPWNSIRKDAGKLTANEEFRQAFGEGKNSVMSELDRIIDKQPLEYLSDNNNVVNRVQQNRQNNIVKKQAEPEIVNKIDNNGPQIQ